MHVIENIPTEHNDNIYKPLFLIYLMDATQQHSLQRKNRIGQIKEILIELDTDERSLDQAAFVTDICIKYDCTERTAKEYITIAKRIIETEK
jgi:hypothetical protein